MKYSLLDKDAFLESLFDLEGIGDAQSRRQLSMRADAQFREAALKAERAVLCSWWRHPRSTADSGTPTEWLLAPDRALVEVHCRCSAKVSADRFAARVRHPGHLDETRSRGAVLQMSQQQEAYGPLFPDRAIVLDTEGHVEMSQLLEAVRSALLQQRVA
jgi:glucokinase